MTKLLVKAGVNRDIAITNRYEYVYDRINQAAIQGAFSITTAWVDDHLPSLLRAYNYDCVKTETGHLKISW